MCVDMCTHTRVGRHVCRHEHQSLEQHAALHSSTEPLSASVLKPGIAACDILVIVTLMCHYDILGITYSSLGTVERLRVETGDRSM